MLWLRGEPQLQTQPPESLHREICDPFGAGVQEASQVPALPANVKKPWEVRGPEKPIWVYPQGDDLLETLVK